MRRRIDYVPGMLLLASLAVAPMVSAQSPEAEQASPDSRPLPEAANGHRPLRANPPLPDSQPSPLEPFTGYADAPPFSVVSRGAEIQNYPCENCHGMLPVNPQRRQLYSPHVASIEHGAGRIWCLDCHAADKRNVLTTFAGQELAFDEAYLVCGQCHSAVQKDWYFGAHGKRVANWQGDREIYNCTHCHDPHAPALRPRVPEAPPPLRRGLDPMPRHGVHSVKESSHDAAKES